MEYDIPTTVRTVEGFTAMDSAALDALRDELGLAMDLDDLKFLQGYFRDDEGRDPTITEIRVVDTYWSDHCRHTTFSTELKNVTFTEGDYKKPIEDTYNQYLADHKEIYKGRDDKFVCLMDLAIMGMKKLSRRKIRGSGGLRGDQRLLHRGSRGDRRRN